MKIPFAIAVALLLIASCPLASTNCLSSREFWEEFDSGFANTFKPYRPGEDVKVEMKGPSRILRGGYGEWTFIFTAGSRGMSVGQAVAVTTRHVSGWGTPQDYDSGAPDFVTATSSAHVSLELIPLQHFEISNQYFYDYFPWQHITQVVIKQGRLLPGESIRLVLGDRSQGSPGFRAPSVSREHALFLGMVRREPEGQFIPIPSRLSVAILPGEARRLNVILPTDTDTASPFNVILRAEDDQGNLAAGYRGTVSFDVQGGPSTLPATYTLEKADQGIHVFKAIRFETANIYRIGVGDRISSLHGWSNPSRCAGQPGQLKIFWGDLHDHSFISDGTGSPADAFSYARDVAGLDFFALTDHDYQMDQKRWEMNQQFASQFNDPPHFVTFYSYEWSGESDVGGDHNVIYAEPDLPLYRSSSYYDPQNPFIYSGPDLGATHIVQLYKRLHLLIKEKHVRVLVVPHWRGRIADFHWNDQEFSPVIELASEAGWNEDWALQFLRRGYVLGFIGSSDDHYGRPGYGMADDREAGYGDRLSFPFGRDRFNNPWGNDTQGSPVVAVITRENDRESIFEAIFMRHCYVTSGPRIILDFRSGSHLMGDEFSSEEPPHFEGSAETISPITALILKKDGQPIDVIQPSERSKEARLSYTERKDFKGHFYYIEVLTADPQERAASSPMWID